MTRKSTKPQPRGRPSALGDATANESAVRVLRQFRRIFNAVKAHFQQMEKTSGLGGAQVWALSVIEDFPNIGVTELATAMDIRQSTASNLIRSLIERELIQSQRNPSDRRAVQLAILPAGKRLLKVVPRPLSGILPVALSALDQATLGRLEEDLAKVLVLLSVDESSAQVLLTNL